MTTLIHRTDLSCARPLSLRDLLMHRLALWRSRRALADLTADQLCDVGLSAKAAAHEARRGIWDAPANWRD